MKYETVEQQEPEREEITLEPCPYCHHAFKSLARHLSKCKDNPANRQAPAPTSTSTPPTHASLLITQVDFFLNSLQNLKMFASVRIDASGKNHGAPGRAREFARIRGCCRKYLAGTLTLDDLTGGG